MYVNDGPNIIYEDPHVLAVHKPAGLATQTSRVSEPDVVSLVERHLRDARANAAKSGKKASGTPHVSLINRLDQPVEGIVLMALDQKTAAALSAQLRDGSMEKHYLAGVLLSGSADASALTAGPETGVIVTPGSCVRLSDHVFFDKRNNTSGIVSPDHPDARPAELEYRILEIMTPPGSCSPTPGEMTAPASDASPGGSGAIRIALADVRLITGRHHQIRVQMANAGMPLLGDRKYAPECVRKVNKLLNISEICLCACGLTFTHPVSNDKMTLRVKPQGKWNKLFSFSY